MEDKGASRKSQHLCHLTILSTVEFGLRSKSVFPIVTQFMKVHNIFFYAGGDEWKLLADRLGFSQIDIRFLDKRYPNPPDVVLGAVANRRHLSVGEIYDTLVDCELPAIADLM